MSIVAEFSYFSNEGILEEFRSHLQNSDWRSWMLYEITTLSVHHLLFCLVFSTSPVGNFSRILLVKQLCDNYVPQRWVEFDDELSWLFTKRFRTFISFAENGQILLKISVIPILLTFIYLVALNLLVNNQLNSLLYSTHHCGRN